MRLRFGLVVVFIGAAVADAAGSTFAGETAPGTPSADDLLSSTDGLGDAMTC